MTDPRLQAVTEALLGARWYGVPVRMVSNQTVTESLAPAVLPVIDAEVAAEVAAKLRAMAERLDEEAKSYDGSFEDGLHMARTFLEAEASRLEPGRLEPGQGEENSRRG
jgi:hypothetical protein